MNYFSQRISQLEHRNATYNILYTKTCNVCLSTFAEFMLSMDKLNLTQTQQMSHYSFWQCITKIHEIMDVQTNIAANLHRLTYRTDTCTALAQVANNPQELCIAQ